MKIFGRTIGCGSCIPSIDTPVGEECLRCGVVIQAGDIGFVIPHETGTPEQPISIERAWHIACLRAALGVEAPS